jgi:2-polyprenyl-6-hydroxyphenyl methylase/3-demethylubiquinone-9 3-methyltransferase
VSVFNTDTWWDEQGEFKALHSLNYVRLEFIKKYATQQGSVLDIGCGGGILCEPLSRIFHDVTGFDISEEAIALAQKRAADQELSIHYTNHIPQDQTYDIVIASEVVEHVECLETFLRQCEKLIKPEGLFFVSTINQTWQARVLGIFMAEYILGLAPRGTHHFKDFVKPSLLQRLLHRFDMIDMTGFSYSVCENKWSFDQDLSINYMAVFRKKLLINP